MSGPVERRWDTGAYVVALAVNRGGTHAAAALGDGTVWLMDLSDTDGMPHMTAAHDGACLALARDIDGTGFLTGGDDGRVRRVAPGAEPDTLAEAKGRWIEHLDASPQARLRAYGAGRRVVVLEAGGRPRFDALEHPSTVGGLAFAPNGKRLAVAHYGGTSLWWTAQAGTPARLEWKGSHLGVVWHPDGTHLITTMQESGLHGWRLKDKADMHMSGYPTKIRSLGWTRRARYLVTGGAESAVCWPFFGGGPWNKRPVELATGSDTLATVVAPHPSEEVLVVGHEDGVVIVAPLDGTPPVVLRHADASPVSAAVWSADGRHLLVGTEGGSLTWFPLPTRA